MGEDGIDRRPEAPRGARVVGDLGAELAAAAADSGGAIWTLAEDPRDLDANLIRLPAGDRIEPFDGPDLDVLVVVLSGDGVLRTDAEEVTLSEGRAVWLPRCARRGFTAGDRGLAYLTVHRRREPEPLMPRLRER